MLTTSQLADLAGTSARAIRHYHRLGLLPEPARRSNGYRSYGPGHLVRLTKIRSMRQVGLTLAEIGRLLASDDDWTDPAWADGTRAALRRLDDDLACQQAEIAERRERIGALLAGPDDLTLPAEIADLLDRLAAAGIDPVQIAAERRSVALVLVLAPDLAQHLAHLYRELLDQPAEALAVSRRFGELADADPDDPAVDAVAADLVDLLRRYSEAAHTADRTRTSPPVAAGVALYDLFQAHLAESLSGAQRRCAELVAERFS